VLQAAIAAEHARAASVEDTDWQTVADLYEQLARLTASPVVEVNRAVALSRAYGPDAGLVLLEQLAGLASLRGYHLVPAVRGDLYLRLGRNEEAAIEFERAAGMTSNEREVGLLNRRAAAARSGGVSGG